MRSASVVTNGPRANEAPVARPMIGRSTNTSGNLPAAVIVADQRVGERPGCQGDGPFRSLIRRVHLDAGIPPERVDERHAIVPRRVADGKVREPAASAHSQQFVGVRGQRVGTQRREVLIRERVANQQVVVRIVPPGERAEGGRHAPGLDVEATRAATV